MTETKELSEKDFEIFMINMLKALKEKLYNI